MHPLSPPTEGQSTSAPCPSAPREIPAPAVHVHATTASVAAVRRRGRRRVTVGSGLMVSSCDQLRDVRAGSPIPPGGPPGREILRTERASGELARPAPAGRWPSSSEEELHGRALQPIESARVDPQPLSRLDHVVQLELSLYRRTTWAKPSSTANPEHGGGFLASLGALAVRPPRLGRAPPPALGSFEKPRPLEPRLVHLPEGLEVDAEAGRH